MSLNESAPRRKRQSSSSRTRGPPGAAEYDPTKAASTILGRLHLATERSMTDEPDLEYPAAGTARAPEDTFRVLFLDSPAQVERLKEACKDVGYVVVGAETSLEAMAFLEGKNHVDVIVCAAHLESDSPFEFLQQVRA